MLNRRTFLAKTPAGAIAAALGLGLTPLGSLPTILAPYPWVGWGVRVEGVDGMENVVAVWLIDPQGRKRWGTAERVTWETVFNEPLFEKVVQRMKARFLVFGSPLKP